MESGFNSLARMIKVFHQNMLVNGILIRELEMVIRFTLMEVNIKVVLKMESLMEMESIGGHYKNP